MMPNQVSWWGATGTQAQVSPVVTSRDYGGSAILRAKATISGDSLVGGPVTVPFSIVNENGKDVEAPKSGCVAAAEFAKRPYASLPVDQDCNGIADHWEKDNGGPYPDPNADSDPGGLKPGDGFTNRDEYRGFHYVTDDWDEASPNTVHLTTFLCYSVWGGRPREWPEPSHHCLPGAASPTSSASASSRSSFLWRRFTTL